MILWLAIAWAHPPTEVERAPVVPGAAEPVPAEPVPAEPTPTEPTPPPPSALSERERAALADQELLEQLALLEDLDVVRYLDLLTLEED